MHGKMTKLEKNEEWTTTKIKDMTSWFETIANYSIIFIYVLQVKI